MEGAGCLSSTPALRSWFRHDRHINHFKMPYGYVYLTKKTDDTLFYVGQHSGEFDPRYLGSGVRLINAKRKYGYQNFEVTLLEFFDSKEELDQGEIDYVSILRFMGVPICNILVGGTGPSSGPNHPFWGKKRPGVSEKLKIAKTGKKRPPFSKEWLANMSRAMLGKKMNLSPESRAILVMNGRRNKGFKHSEEEIARRVATRKRNREAKLNPGL